jgi:hypothetical protein
MKLSMVQTLVVWLLPFRNPSVGVCNLKALSFYVDHIHNGRVIEWTPELDHLILSCDDFIPRKALKSILQSLASHSIAYSLTKISVGDPDLTYPGTSILIYRLSSSLGKSTNSRSCALYRSISVTTAARVSHLP